MRRPRRLSGSRRADSDPITAIFSPSSIIAGHVARLRRLKRDYFSWNLRLRSKLGREVGGAVRGRVSRGVLPKSGRRKNNSTNAGGDLLKPCSHDGSGCGRIIRCGGWRRQSTSSLCARRPRRVTGASAFRAFRRAFRGQCANLDRPLQPAPRIAPATNDPSLPGTFP